MTLILSGTDGLSDVDGTAATPAIRGTDANTGIFFPAADTIAFSEGGAEAMRIDSSGNVGIGTSSPSSFTAENDSKLTVGTGSGNGGITVYTGSTSQGGIFFADGTSGAATYSGILRYNHSDNAMLFYTNGLNERARIDSSGNLLVGAISPLVYGTFEKFTVSSPSGNAAVLSAGGNTYPTLYIAQNYGSGTQTYLYFVYNGTPTGSVTSTGSTTVYGTSSDYRLKENIQPLTGALAKVALLKPCTYKWKVDGSDGQGFIAHELQEVYPDAVTGEKDGEQMQGVDYGKLTPILTAALQEAITKIETLEARIAVLEAK